ncbi:bifunctional 4-hydroxy-2-oxoglutarate aldolase/2-dehydro-3-deoxy-phosphogluconate aldolase [Thiopseudomonas sp. CY1220]|uniref:2-dehydro-3-deoxy-phosphogluconate aldolase n=2 Tax=Thiopseudomonas acetoxidans TaxID=3041622 RepID=A0ABT7SMV3_9GAMM|nr:bifunctional 4-hydroxy-2-oxoglutarate aldolase/2-dehydro-3-deoxy-phosphogluconate aldolase [Thiopseudomonas sp. CY1220]MDM7857344.1 bifunctional 4-hydroxy-2-oxoglutarate aldolase/2-dehydro-3-deoxy-phosphogluconate aldolase [Thiopseudomonas sp. CY1220]NLW03888.1 bifunctional 4-hydroxy-2-oxoglutarate aldolase/2-dehydro-3-deoxy-phosphogluconate aldolase [Pseudomonadaceae bacterium]
MMHSIEQILAKAYPVLPVLVVNQPDTAIALAQALHQGGVQVLEITLRTPQALEVVTTLRQQLPELLVGVGTVVQAEQFEQAKQAGAQFAVSPGFTPQLADAAQASALPYLPAVMTPSEVLHAMEHGYRTLKLFPASLEGSLKLLDSFKGPFTDIKFCPTGGIQLDNLLSFLKLPNVICCGGSWLAPDALVRANDWRQITALAQQAQELARSLVCV